MTMPHTRGLGGANSPRTLLALSLAVMVVVSMSVGGAAADDTDTPTLLPSSRFGFYLHVYQQPAAVIFQVRPYTPPCSSSTGMMMCVCSERYPLKLVFLSFAREIERMWGLSLALHLKLAPTLAASMVTLDDLYTQYLARSSLDYSASPLAILIARDRILLSQRMH